MPVFGCVADDFTGAGDAASFLVKGGMPVQLFNGVPKAGDEITDGVQAVVIALKSRTQDIPGAVKDTLRAFEWLKNNGVEQFYLKYCSTFDSTPKGNIGPAADAVMELLQVPYTILCPALPVNGRVVKKGDLYVNGVPLHQSPMKNHPLTPMWDCKIKNLMKPQSRYSCVELWNEEMKKTKEEINEILAKHEEKKIPFYIIPDYQSTEDGERIADVFGELKFLTGGSGILEYIAKKWSMKQKPQEPVDIKAKGPALLLAGSCSKATLSQISHFQKNGGLSYKLEPAAMIEGKMNIEDAWRFVEKNRKSSVLIYSSDIASNVNEAQRLGRERVAEMLEQTAAELGKRAVESGICRIIVAGGETSGAVTKSLGFSSYKIGESIAPGVPVMIPVVNNNIRLILKSGNFGQEDFFEKALHMTGMEDE